MTGLGIDLVVRKVPSLGVQDATLPLLPSTAQPPSSLLVLLLSPTFAKLQASLPSFLSSSHSGLWVLRADSCRFLPPASKLSSAAGRRCVDVEVASAPACPEWSSRRLPPPTRSARSPAPGSEGLGQDAEGPLWLPASLPQATLSPSVTPVGVTFRSAQSRLLPSSPCTKGPKPPFPSCGSGSGFHRVSSPPWPAVSRGSHRENPPWAHSTQRTAGTALRPRLRGHLRPLWEAR